MQLCLDALSHSLQGLTNEVIVIDNLSGDDSCTVVKQHYPWVKLIENPSNDGFGKANNIAIKQARGKIILLLNPDTIVSSNTLHDALSALRSSKDVGAIGVKMLDGSGRYLPESKRGLPTPEVAFYKAFGFTSFFPHSKRFARYYLGHLPDDEVCDIEVLAGAFMMIKAEVLNHCKGFDEDFFMYGEDIDLSYRISLQGYRHLYLPHSPIIHFKGESSGRDAVWAARFYDAMHLFSQKHFSNSGILFNKIVSLGIHFRKMFAPKVVKQKAAIDKSQLSLFVVTNEELDLTNEFYHAFKSCEQGDVHQAQSQGIDAFLFMAHVDSRAVIDLISQHRDHYFFFATQHGNHILFSPSSEHQGEIFTL